MVFPLQTSNQTHIINPIHVDDYSSEHYTRLIQRDVSHLQQHVYLDHAGAPLYPITLIQAYKNDLTTHLYGNPHSSGSPSAQLTSDRINRIRLRILQWLKAPIGEYEVVFTANATSALKLVAELLFCSTPQATDKMKPPHFWYLSESHTSMVGMREMAYRQLERLGVSNVQDAIAAKSESWISHWLTRILLHPPEEAALEYDQASRGGLFAFPAQCNFSGRRFPLEKWIRSFLKVNKKCPFATDGSCSQKRWRVLVDAASYCSTVPLDLSQYPADYVVVSFYKIFGFPTGLGALIVRKDAVSKQTLRERPYFGGGSVDAISFDRRWHQPRQASLSSALEDGTLNFLDIMALDYGFDYIENTLGGWKVVQTHTRELTQHLYKELRSLSYAENSEGIRQPLCKIHLEGSKTYELPENHGPIINMSLYRRDGTIIGFSEVMKLAAMNNIHIRTGCFCNLGACERYLGITSQDVENNIKSGHVCGDDNDIVNGHSTGSIRISVGFLNTMSDIRTWIQFLRVFFLRHPQSIISNPNHHSQISPPITEVPLHALSLYPIKSCGGFTPNSPWPISNTGLLYDREWVIVNGISGDVMTQKSCPMMALIKPIIDMVHETMTLSALGMEKPIVVPITSREPHNGIETSVCGDQVTLMLQDQKGTVDEWLSLFLGRSVRLARMSHMHKAREMKHNSTHCELSNSNESPFLLVHQLSYNEVRQRSETERELVGIMGNGDFPDIRCFRANFVVAATNLHYPFEEDTWVRIAIGDQIFKVIGPCRRCRMICIHPDTGVSGKEPLATLVKFRRQKGRVLFGAQMVHDEMNSRKPYVISPNSKVRILDYLQCDQTS